MTQWQNTTIGVILIGKNFGNHIRKNEKIRLARWIRVRLWRAFIVINFY